MKKSKFGKQEEQYPLNIGDAIFAIDPLKNKVTEYRVTYLHNNGHFEAVSGVSNDIFYPISTLGQLFFMSRVEAKEYLRNNRQSILDEYRKIFEKTGDWSKLAELGNILAEEKENAQGGACVSAEEIESALATLAYIKLMFEKDCSIDWQIETGLWTPEGVDNPVRYHKDLVAKGLEGAISILASLQ